MGQVCAWQVSCRSTDRPLAGPVMSEYLHVENPFLDQLATLGWTVIDQGQGFIPSDPVASLRGSSRDWLLLEVFRTDGLFGVVARLDTMLPESCVSDVARELQLQAVADADCSGR